MTITHRAWSASARYLYEGFGSSQDRAKAALRRCLEEHAGQMGYDDGWEAETFKDVVVQDVRPGGSNCGRDDAGTVWTGLVEGGQPGPVGHRAVVETSRGETHVAVDGYGDTEDDALAAARAGVMVLHPDGMDGTLSVEDLLDDVTIYAVADGGAYRGGLETSYGARLA